MDAGWNRRRWKRAVWMVLAALLCLGLALVAFWQAFEWHFHRSPAPAAFPAPVNAAEAVRQDLTHLANLLDVDRSFSPAARAAFERERQQLLARADSLTPGPLEMAVSHAVALAGNGHTTVYRRSLRLGRLPIRVAWFAEGLFVLRTTAAHAELLGAQVLRINGRTPDALLAGLTPYLSGTPEHAKAASPLLLEMPAALAGIWADMNPQQEAITLRQPDGGVVDVELAGIAPDPTATPMDIDRILSPQRAPAEPAGWTALLADSPTLPLSLQHPDASTYAQALDDGRALYINLRQIADDDKGSLGDQLDAILRPIAPGSLRYAILDLRFDGGGNYMKTLSFTKALPTRIAADGRLIILTNHATFSAAIVTLARAKYFGGARSLIMGERVGDREQFWAESASPVVLPNSKIHIGFATGYHDWAATCRGQPYCYWFNYLFEVPAGSLAPDITVAWRFDDYLAGRDTVIEAALARARREL